jgi:hypothetical protein
MAGNKSIGQFLKVYTKDYKGPTVYGGLYNSLISPERAIFFRHYIPLMMRDPHLWYGMELLKGPIVSKAKFLCESDDTEVIEFVERQFDRFWQRAIDKALDCLVWGYSGSEVEYEFSKSNGTLEFKDLRYLHPSDIKPVIKDGELLAIEIRHAEKCEHSHTTDTNSTIYLKPPKVFWTVHDKKASRWFGRSRLEGAFDSWWEIWQPKGYRGIRHLWYYRHAYDGGVLYYPDGTTQDPETAEEVSNAIIAQEMLDRKETGSSLALPNKTGENRDWEYENPKGNPPPEGLLEYGDVLRDELWEGIGVPPEVAKQEETGSFAGRRVPQQAFYSYVQQIANEIAWDFDDQIVRKLVKLVYGPDVDYEIVPKPIMETLQEEEMGGGTDAMGEEGMEQEFDEEGNPIESGDSESNDPFTENGVPKAGKVEDRDSNAFNMKEKSMKKNGISKGKSKKKR